jgi:hypothetical protein
VRTLDEFKKTADVLRPYLEKAFADKGIVMLAEYTYPLQVVWGKKKLTSLDDFKGMKLRVAQPEQGEMVRRFGGTSVTISAPEVPSALDRGVVDGIFTAGVGAVLWKDLLKFGFLIPGELEQLLHPRERRSVQQALARPAGQAAQGAQDAAKWNQDTMQTEEAASVKTLTDAGYTMTDGAAGEAAKVADTMKPYWDEWAKSRGPVVVEGTRQGARGARPLTMSTGRARRRRRHAGEPSRAAGRRRPGRARARSRAKPR